MPTVPNLVDRLARVVSLVAIAALVFGCATFGAGTTGPLVTIDAHGGRCVEGECRAVTTIDRSGRLTIDADGGPQVLSVAPDLLRVLAAAVDSTDYARITAVPFEGLCSTAVDGMELTYTFHPAGRPPVTFSSCEVAIDPADPLFHALFVTLPR